MKVEFLFKVILAGDLGVGKTSLRDSFVGRDTENFRGHYQDTFEMKAFEMEGIKVGLQLWDVPPWDLRRNLGHAHTRKRFYLGSFGALLVFDKTMYTTLKSIPQWAKQIWTNNENKKIPIVIVGNKIDLEEKCLEHVIGTELIIETLSFLNAQVKEENFTISYVETSALTGFNVENAFLVLVREILVWIGAI